MDVDFDLLDPSNLATIRENEIINATENDFPGNIHGKDCSWNMDAFIKKFKVKIKKLSEDYMEFDFIGISPPIANAFRRIMMSEVPTIAIEKVHVTNNTSLLQDEFLAHRLGLIPIKANPLLFEYRAEGVDKVSPQDTIIFKLNVKCTKNPKAKDAVIPEERYLNRLVHTDLLEWIPIETQKEDLGDHTIKPVHDDILIAKLALGQEIDLEAHCVKGIGRDHAKFSPVSTASYRLLPEIKLLKEFVDEEAELLQSCFSKGVIKIEDRDGKQVAKVSNARLDSCSRNVFRYEEIKDFVKMDLVKDYFIYTIESTGCIPSTQIIEMSFDILINKCEHFLNEVKELKNKKIL